MFDIGAILTGFFFNRRVGIGIYKNANTAPLENEDKVYIVSSSDRGLCGGIHSSVAKATRRLIAQDGSSSAIVVLGDKAKNQMSRTHRGDIQLSFNQIGKAIPTFAEACAAADTIKTSGIKFDTATIIYNEFTSAIAYEATPINVYSSEALKAAGTSLLSLFCITVSSCIFSFSSSSYSSSSFANMYPSLHSIHSTHNRCLRCLRD